MLKVTCCHHCENRHTACHDTCEEYLAIKAENEKVREKIKNDNRRYDEIVASVDRMKTKRRRRKNG